RAPWGRLKGAMNVEGGPSGVRKCRWIQVRALTRPATYGGPCRGPVSATLRESTLRHLQPNHPRGLESGHVRFRKTQVPGGPGNQGLDGVSPELACRPFRP